MERTYYSQRTGLNKSSMKIDIFQLKKLFQTIYRNFHDKDYFRQKIGCNAGGNYYDYCYGELGTDTDISNFFFLSLRKENLWPIYNHLEDYSEDDLFDIIEFCYDNISVPIIENSFTEIGSVRYDVEKAQEEFREQLNKQLKDYGDGFELDKKGNIVKLTEFGIEPIFEAEILSEDERIIKPMENAIAKFRNRSSSHDDRRDAVKNLADVLEYLRPLVKNKVIKKDESALFDIANNFNIRHNNVSQKTDYDSKIWLNWIFYLFLSTIHAWIRIINKEQGTT
jgi:hypothetical protein